MKNRSARTAIILIVAATAMACGGPRATIAPMLKHVGYKVAVLTFASSGFLSSQKPGKFAADELTKALALQKKAFVVDRSLVNAATARVGITSPNFLTHGQLKALAEDLKVQLIVLGEVQNIQNSFGDLSNRKMVLLVTYRILDPDTGTLLGLVSHQGQTRSEPKKLLMKMTNEMVRQIDGLSIPERWADAHNGSTSKLDSTSVVEQKSEKLKIEDRR